MLKQTLVLGASTNPSRYSNIAVKRLRNYNHPVIAVGLRSGTISDVEIDTIESAFAKAETHKKNLDTVSLYLGAKRQPEYYEYMLSLQPKRVIFNPGTENPEFYEILNENGIAYEVACTLVLLATNQY